MNEYWEKRYVSGGKSGPGSIGLSRKWKWNVINSYIPAIDQVIDVGCGDLSFWDGKNCKNYIGIDVSQTIIKRNEEKRPKWHFIVSPAETRIIGLKSECVFCLDVLFHIMDDEKFIAVLNNLCYYSIKYIVIHTWMRNPLTKNMCKRNLRNILVGIIKQNTKQTRDSLRMLCTLLKTPYMDRRYQFYRYLEKYMDIFRSNDFMLINKKENPDKIGALYIFKKNVS